MPPIVARLGQSNASVRGPVQHVPNYVDRRYHLPFPAVQEFYKLGDSPQDPLVWGFEVGPSDLAPVASGNGMIGVEASLCRMLVAEGYEHALATFAIGSTSLGVHWLPTGTFPDGDNLFTRAVAFLLDAETQLDGEIAEIVWIQGEADAGNATHAANYAASLRALIEAFRETFPGVPFTINRLHSRAGGDHNATVRAAQDLVARTVPGVRILSSEGLPLDGAHYTTQGYLELGERFAAALLEGRARGAHAGIRSGVRSGPRASAGPNFPPVAAFTFSDTGFSVAFTDTSEDLEGAIARWHWDFGDGETSTEQDPTHVYVADGTYAVTLTAYDSRGRAGRLTTSIEITEALWEIDATSGIAVPADSTEWDALAAAETLAVGSPEHLWLFQDASGNLAAAVGGKTLTMTGTPLFQQTETGWARKFVTADTGSGANRSAANSTMTANTTSVLLLGYARIVQPVNSHQRMCYGSASSNALEAVGGSSVARYRTGASAANGSASHVGQVRPFVLLHDTSGDGRMALYTDIEKVSPAYAARTGTDVRFTFSLSTDATSNTAFGYAAAWSGAAIDGLEDADVKALLEALGWTVTGW